MKVTEEELKEMIREVVTKNIATLKESSDFTAKRNLIHSAQQASMEFEKEILGTLNLISPDDLPSNLQQKYMEIAEEMKGSVVKVVADAVARFATLPRQDQGGGNGQQGR